VTVGLTVTNSSGTVFLPANHGGSSGVFITNSPPFITQQATNQSALTNTTVSFTVMANGKMPLFYQWRFNSNDISVAVNSTATSPTLMLANVTSANAGFYDAVVTNSLGTTMSAPVRLVVTNGTSLNPSPQAFVVESREIRLGPVIVTSDGVVIPVLDTAGRRHSCSNTKTR